jgi:phosphoribosyl 1,2-cyclic phosphodiesterase
VTVVVRSLGSGSSGNALVIETGRDSILVDCGLSAATVNRGIRPSGRTIESLTAVLISHEHVDHVRGLQRVLKGGTELVATPGTFRALDPGRVSFRSVRLGESIELGSAITARALGVAHDAAEPCGFWIDAAGVRITVVTDLGSADDDLAEWIASSDLIVLEANHDEEMLRRGPYPSHLKRRVLSENGHLSNADCGRLLQRALMESTRPRAIWLAHLSAVNNRPDLAVAAVSRALAGVGADHAIRALPRTGTPIVWRSDDPFGEPMRTRQLSLF